jgi:hypothetical protein
MLPVHQRFKTWAQSSAFTFWYVEFFWFLLGFLVILGLIRYVVAIIWFNRLFNDYQVDVKILHPDGAGGLYPLGSFGVKVAYVIGAYGTAIVVNTMAQSYLLTGQYSGLSMNLPLGLIILGYVVLAPLVFFAPIGAAHSAMKNAKDEFVLQIAEQFETDLTKLRSLLSADSEELERNLGKLEQLRKLYRMSSQFPVWPFNTRNLVRFVTVVLSPLLIALVPSLIEALLR